MTTSNGPRLPSRAPPQRLPDVPPLPGAGGDLEHRYTPPIRPPSPDAQTVPRVFAATRVQPRVPSGIFSPAAENAVPQIRVPMTWDEVLFWVTLMTPAREVSVVLEQTIAPGASGTLTASIPANTVDVARVFRESGDGSVSYSIEVDGVGRTAIATHRVSGGERVFARFFEKFATVSVNFTNNDAVNSALIQIEWVGVQLETGDWQNFRDYLKLWGEVINIVE